MLIRSKLLQIIQEYLSYNIINLIFGKFEFMDRKTLDRNFYNFDFFLIVWNKLIIIKAKYDVTEPYYMDESTPDGSMLI